MTTGAADFSLYVHWPFCARICPYCDFNVRLDRGVDAARWLAALTRELEHWRAKTGERRLASLYFGGGTPSLAPLGVIEGVIEAAARLWGFDDGAEITLEANPADADIGRLAAFRSAGVNRLSLGVQSFDDAALKFLGRDHDGASALRAIDAALATFPGVTADFIYALPGQSDAQWTEELERALATGLRHLSLYQLTIESGTAFDRSVAQHRWAPASEDRAADLFDLTQALTAEASLPAYEVSNHAAPGWESRHNMNYWRQGDYLGIGPGAHGRVTIDTKRIATETEKNPARYLAEVERSGSGAVVNDPLTEEAILAERLTMGLRTLEGTELRPESWAQLENRISRNAAAGLLIRRENRLIATPDGRRVLNALVADLLI